MAERSVRAFHIVDRGGAITVPFQGATRNDNAFVDTNDGIVRISAEFSDLPSPASFGPEYRGYVMWVVSPDSAPVSLGELARDGELAKIDAHSKAETFGLLVTAERDPGAQQPSGEVVLESGAPSGIETVPARYELLPARVAPAESAVERVTEKRNEFVDERAAALARERAARAAAEAARKRASTVDRERAEEEADIAARQRSVAEALAAVEQSKLDQLGADEVAPWSPAEISAELNKILETHASGRGVVIDASSLFYGERYGLRADAENSLLQVAGILRGGPELEFEVYARIGGSGSAESDQRLSNNLANDIRDFLIDQGFDPRSIFTRDLAAPAGVDEEKDEKKLEIVVSEAKDVPFR